MTERKDLADRLEALIAAWPATNGDPPDTEYQRGYMAACEEHARELQALLAADAGGWRPIETAPVDRPILWRERPRSRVSVVDIDDYGECYLTPGSLWHEIPPTPQEREPPR